MKQRRITSPNRRTTGKLLEKGRIRFGPSVHELELSPYDFSSRVFLLRYQWSDCSRYLAIAEALTAEDGERPFMEISIFDLTEGREFSVPNVDGQSVFPSHFELPKFFYTKPSGMYEIEFENLRRWRPIPKRRR